MTGVGGLLLLLDDRPIPHLDGLALPALASTGAPSAIESVFQTREPLDRARWRGVVIHHSGASFGSPASIARSHEQLGFRGLGHHFIIGNGSGMQDGELYVGHRWLQQLPGAHAGGPDGDLHNRHSISVCLVGNGDRRPFTQLQMRRLTELLSGLGGEFGMAPDAMMLHREVAPTSDPGRLFPASFRDGLVEGR